MLRTSALRKPGMVYKKSLSHNASPQGGLLADMDNIHRRSYTGPLKAIILDWAGTTIDYGCFAPVTVFIEVFRQRGVNITLQQAREPMGLGKKDHIRAITRMEPVARQWETLHGRPCSEKDIDSIYQNFAPLQAQVVVDNANIIPGTLEAVAAFRARGLKIGSTTGYDRTVMDVLLHEARQRDYTPDTSVCVDDVPAGRPHPWMCLQVALNLQVYPAEACVKVGDTVPDILEGLNAGMWTIGVACTGNELGLTEQEVATMPPDVLRTRLRPIYQHLYKSGAHFVVDSIADVPPILDRIEGLLKQRERSLRSVQPRLVKRNSVRPRRTRKLRP